MSKLYIAERIEGVTNHYHSEAAVVLIAYGDPLAAIDKLFGGERTVQSWEYNEDSLNGAQVIKDALADGKFKFTSNVPDQPNQLFVFPDSGCC